MENWEIHHIYNSFPFRKRQLTTSLHQFSNSWNRKQFCLSMDRHLISGHPYRTTYKDVLLGTNKTKHPEYCSAQIRSGVVLSFSQNRIHTYIVIEWWASLVLFFWTWVCSDHSLPLSERNKLTVICLKAIEEALSSTNFNISNVIYSFWVGIFIGQSHVNFTKLLSVNVLTL